MLLVCHDPVETTGHAAPVLRGEGLEVLRADAWASDFRLPDLADIGGIVMFGGEMNVDMTAEFPNLLTERELVKRAIGESVPYLGICLGAQMLARVLGVDVHPSPAKEVGFTEVRPTEAAADDRLLGALEPGLMVFHWHEDTHRQPPGTTLLATNDHVPMQAYRVDGVPAWGVQFHFEVDRAEIELWTSDAGPSLAERWGKSAEAMLAEADLYLASQEAFARKAFRDFAEVVREQGA